MAIESRKMVALWARNFVSLPSAASTPAFGSKDTASIAPNAKRVGKNERLVEKFLSESMIVLPIRATMRKDTLPLILLSAHRRRKNGRVRGRKFCLSQNLHGVLTAGLPGGYARLRIGAVMGQSIGPCGAPYDRANRGANPTPRFADRSTSTRRSR